MSGGAVAPPGVAVCAHDGWTIGGRNGLGREGDYISFNRSVFPCSFLDDVDLLEIIHGYLLRANCDAIASFQDDVGTLPFKQL